MMPAPEWTMSEDSTARTVDGDRTCRPLGQIDIHGPRDMGGARGFARELLGDDHPVLDDVQLCLTELIGNSFIHTDSATVTVVILANDQTIRLEVVDAGAPGNAPHIRDDRDDIESENGRGLRIVHVLTGGRWGSRGDETGQVTWAEIEYDHGVRGGSSIAPGG